jgi:23S rRNA pseudouridine1911/1915/1917 synthase
MIDQAVAGSFEIPILHLDNHLLVAVKPPNLPSQADRSGDIDMLTALKDYIGRKYDKPGAVYLGLVHRLDRPAGGVMAFARTSKAAARLSAAFAGREVDKRYLAIVQGEMAGPVELSHYLVKDEATGTVHGAEEGETGAKLARLCTKPLACRNQTTLVEVQLFTGRSHQIRVQHLLIGHPLWGDSRYGGGRPGQQLALWAHSLALAHPTLKAQLCFCATPPAVGAWEPYRDVLEECACRTTG